MRWILNSAVIAAGAYGRYDYVDPRAKGRHAPADDAWELAWLRRIA